MSKHQENRLLSRNNWNDQNIVTLSVTNSIWNHFYTVSPLVVIGTKEYDQYDLAPKHMAMALGQENYFGFICTPKHATYHNAKHNEFFTVSFPKPDQVTLASLAAAPRCEEVNYNKKIVDLLPTIKAPNIDALFLKDAYLYLECTLHNIIDGFGQYSLISGKIIGAHVDEKYLKIYDQDDQSMLLKSPLLGFLAYSRYTVIRESNDFPMPKDFTHIDD